MLRNLIIGGSHRGRKVSVLMEVRKGVLTVMDINGYSPSAFPKNVSAAAVRKMSPSASIPLLQRSHNPEPDYDLSEFAL